MHILLTTERGTEEVSVVPGSTVLSVLQDRQIPFVAPCGGRGLCGRCRVLIKDHRGTRYRRACQTEVAEGMEVIFRRMSGIVSQRGNCSSARYAHLLRRYPPDRGVMGFGMAIDVGTTTLLVRLHDLRSGACLATASCLNPEMRFGSDVMSRVSAAAEGCLWEMRSTLVDAIHNLFERLCVDTHITHDEIKTIVLAGNSVMEHIAAGISPESLGTAPFAPQTMFGDAHELFPNMPEAWFVPLLGGQVGGDIAAGALAADMLDVRAPRLFIDIGTNGEIVLATPQGTCCCSTAAGPAFEGGGILYGMPALPGAISSVEFVHGRIVCQTVGDIVPQGICGTGLVDSLKVMLELGVMDADGLLRPVSELPPSLQELRGVRDGIEVFYLVPERGIYLSQKDIRSLQLCNAAIRAGVSTLLDHCGITPDDVEWVGIAGDFGANLSLRSVEAIRLLPHGLAHKAECLGNTAIDGASCALISDVARADLLGLSDTSTSLELASLSSFQNTFMDALRF
jgi:uncharacterized 2Fe-2S/4Fe-4S cluster protein (DUF4445 family)